MKNLSIGLICFAIATLGLLPLSAHAEISHPYSVDEKSRVLFGDTVPVESFDGQATTTYYGLENYSQDYVNGYAHFSFTYTHTIDNYASYPPIIYVTDIDPRTNANAFSKSLDYAFFLRDKWYIPGPHQTDWYHYDIQFDSTGYMIVVKQSEQTEIVNEHRPVPNQQDSDWAAIANQMPTLGTPSPYTMAFTPIPIKEGPQNPDPVIIIPGIMGSAKKNGQLVLDPILHTYDDLVDTLLANGYEEGATLFKFPYEWRDSNVLTADLLDDKITEVKQICNCNKVDLVAHSMGGLVARAYIQSVDYDQDVDQLIFLGTPHKGSPTDYLTWEAGEISPGLGAIPQGIFFQAEALKNGYPTVFDYIRNRPILSVKELLPTLDYLVDSSSGIARTYPNNYPRNNFLENLNENVSRLFTSGVKISNIKGDTGENKTVEKITVTASTHSGLWEHGQPENYYQGIGNHGLERGQGDNTVPVSSGSFENSLSDITIQAEHRRIPTVASPNVYNFLTNKNATTIIDRGFQLSPKMLIVQLLSPIDVVVTAPDGKKVGKNFAGGEYSEIPNAFYSGNQTDEEYVTILNPLDGEYKVEVKGTGSGGEYGMLTSYASDEFATTTRANGITQPNQVTELKVKIDNENPDELEASKIITSEVLLNDINKAYELGWITDKKFKDNLVKKAEKIITIEKVVTTANKRRVERLQTRIDSVAARALAAELRAYKRNKINEQAYNIIKEDLEYLINN